MAAKPLPSIETLRQLLRYEADTGKLYWRARPLGMFRSAMSCKTWNTRFAGKEALTAKTKRGYSHGFVNRIKFYAHRVAWALHHGKEPEGQIDHVNGDKADNRIENLRIATFAENARNMPLRRNNTSGVAGICWSNQRNAWRARIAASGGKEKHLGWFKTFEEACAARKAAETQLGYHANHGRAA